MPTTRDASTTHPGHKVTKPYTLKPKPKVKDTAITDEIEAQLHEYTLSLANNSELEIDAAEQKARDELDATIAALDQLCDVLQTAEACVSSDITTEWIEISNTDHGDGTEVVSLDERMKQFRDEVKDRTTRLEDLWEAWSSVQVEIVCLAVECLGREVIDNDSHDPDGFRETVAGAHMKYESSCTRDKQSEVEMRQLQARLEDLGRNSVAKSKQLLRDATDMDREQKKRLAAALKSLGDI